MNIVIPAPVRALPKIRKIAQMIKALGRLDDRHRIAVLTVPSALVEVQKFFDGIPHVQFHPVLSPVYREPPASANDPFMHAARLMTDSHWFYLSPETLPLVSGWADALDRAYRDSGKKYLGCQKNLPKRFRDVTGVERVDLGDPYILEAAVYPANLLSQSKIRPRQQGLHHEVQRRHEMNKSIAVSDLVASAEWSEEFAPRAPQVVVTRLLGDAVFDRLLQSAPPLPPESTPAEEPPEPKLAFDPGDTEATVDAKRGRGRPRKLVA